MHPITKGDNPSMRGAYPFEGGLYPFEGGPGNFPPLNYTLKHWASC